MFFDVVVVTMMLKSFFSFFSLHFFVVQNPSEKKRKYPLWQKNSSPFVVTCLSRLALKY